MGQLKKDPMAPSDQIDFFMQGLKEPIRKLCAWDPAIRGPFENLQRLVEYATALDITHNRTSHQSVDEDPGHQKSSGQQNPNRGKEQYKGNVNHGKGNANQGQGNQIQGQRGTDFYRRNRSGYGYQQLSGQKRKADFNQKPVSERDPSGTRTSTPRGAGNGCSLCRMGCASIA